MGRPINTGDLSNRLQAYTEFGVFRELIIKVVEAMIADCPTVEMKEHTATINWVSVKERLPETKKAVLVYAPERKNMYCAYYDDGGRWYVFGVYRLEIVEEVIAWRELPELYGREA